MEAQRLGLATQNGNPVGSRSAPVMTPPMLRIRQQWHVRNGRRLKGSHSMLIYIHAAPKALQRSETNVPKMKSPWLLGQPRAFC
jgi:hypothetical protein